MSGLTPLFPRQPFRIVADRVQLELARFLRFSVRILAQGADHQPSPSDLGIVPGGHDIGARAEDQMEMVRENAEAKQIDPETTRKMLQTIFEPLFAMVVIRPRGRVVSQQEATPNAPLYDVDDRDFVRIEYF